MTELDQAVEQLKAALLEAVTPMAEWFIRHLWVLAVWGGIVIGLVVGLTILGWYEVR